MDYVLFYGDVVSEQKIADDQGYGINGKRSIAEWPLMHEKWCIFIKGSPKRENTSYVWIDKFKRLVKGERNAIHP